LFHFIENRYLSAAFYFDLQNENTSWKMEEWGNIYDKKKLCMEVSILIITNLNIEKFQEFSSFSSLDFLRSFLS